jgi:hypothetical protein
MLDRRAAAVWVAGTLASCAPPALVRGGRPEATILISPAASADEKLAAQELQEYVRKISGATLPTRVTTGADTPSEVRIGVYGSPPVEGWTGERPVADGFAIDRRGSTLSVVGGSPRGALYGVYDVLEADLGVRWFMPGDLGEDVPETDSIGLPQTSRAVAPAFSAVGGFIWAGGPGSAAWERRVRARVGATDAFFGHNWARIIAPTAANKQAHPDWFALVNGERTNQLCSAHPDVVRITVERAREFFDRNRNATLFSISPNDGYGFCEDWRCRAVDEQYGVTDGSLTDRFVHYANEVLRDLGQTHPGKQVGMLAYVQHTRPPVSARPHPDYVTLIAHTPWEFCHVHALDDPACAANRRFADYVKGWTRVCRRVGVYDYYGHFYVFTPWPVIHGMRRDLPFLHSLGVDRFMSETQQHWANQGINFYVGAKLAWNPKVDVDALLADYHRRFYGAAAAPMQRYWERWERAMIATGARDGGYEWLSMFTPELLAEAERDLAEAEALVATERVKVRQRVAFARMGFRFTEAWTRMRMHAQASRWPAALAAGEEAIARVRETTDSVPQAFWIELVVGQMRSTMQPYHEALLRGE